jgi:hypothetical protein
MEATFVAVSQFLSQASEPMAILLWGFVLILLSVRLRARTTNRRLHVVEDPQVTPDRSLAARA